MIVNPFYLIGWLEWIQPGFFAELWAGRDTALLFFGLMFAAGTAGSLVLFKDTLKEFRTDGTTVTEPSAGPVRPFFRGLCGLLGMVFVAAALIMLTAMVRMAAGGDAIEFGMGLLFIVALALVAPAGGVCCYAALFGHQPRWMCPRSKPNESRAGALDGN